MWTFQSEEAESGIKGSAASATTTNQNEALYSTQADTDDIYRVPQNNDPIDPSKLPPGVLYQVRI